MTYKGTSSHVGAGFSRPCVGLAKASPYICLVLIPLALAAQQRDPSTVATGPASLSGIVLHDATAQPLRRATVSLTGAAIQDSRHAVTDEAGRFAYGALPFGQYTLNVQKPGYVSTFYGSRRPGRGPGQPIGLSAAEPDANVVVRVPRGAVITGTVTDTNGRPSPYARVTAMQYRMALGERQLTSVPSPDDPSTDDRGIYRIYGLAAGEYVVKAAPHFEPDAPAVTTEQLRWAQQQFRQQGVGGAELSAAAPPSPAGVGYSEIYYPGTADAAGAAVLTLATGEERTGVDFVIQHVPTARISGIVTDPTGRGVRDSQIRLVQMPQAINAPVSTSRSADGGFVISGVPPGQYTIAVRTNSPPMRGGADVTVSGMDLADLNVTLRPGSTMRGVVRFQGAAATAQELSAARVTLVPLSSPAGFPDSTLRDPIWPDGTFSITGIFPGKYRFAVDPPDGPQAASQSSWIAASATLNGLDVLDRLLTVTAEDRLDDVVVTFSDRPAQLSGRLLDATGQPAKGFTVVLFTADRTFWGLQSRRTRQARPDPSGRFGFAGLLGGDYYICALTDFDPSDTADPTFYDALVGASLRITLAEGERKVQDLRLARRPESF